MSRYITIKITEREARAIRQASADWLVSELEYASDAYKQDNRALQRVSDRIYDAWAKKRRNKK